MTVARNDILAEHLDRLAWLWGRREAMLFSPMFRAVALAAHDRRIEGHVRGLLAGGDGAVPLLASALTGDEPAKAAAAAYVLLRRGTLAGDQAVLRALAGAGGDSRAAIGRALCMAPIDAVAPDLERLMAGGPTSAAAAEVLAFHGRLDPGSARLAELRADDDPEVRRTAWRTTALLGESPPGGSP